MLWYSVYETVGGILLSHGSIDPGVLQPGRSSRSDEGRQDQVNVWNPATTEWEARPEKRTMQPSEFIGRFNNGELMDIGGSVLDEAQSFRDTMLLFTLEPTEINLDGSKTNSMMQGLVIAGLLTAPRKNAILA